MKLKDVGFFQRHVEKVVLSAAVLFLLVFVLLYVVGQPFTAESGSRSLAPAEIEQELATKSQQLQQQLRSEESELPAIEIAPYAEHFAQRVEQPPLELASLPPVGPPGLQADALADDIERPRYALPTPPVPENLITRTNYGVLGDLRDSRARQQVIEQIGMDTDTPMDFQAVSVSAEFDMDQWVDRLRARPRDRELQQIPERWWHDKLAVAGVTLQRETLDPATGEWGERTLIEPLPTQQGHMPGQTSDWPREEAEQRLDALRQNQQLVTRPEFLPLAKGTWLPPTEAFRRLSAEQQEELLDLTEEISRLERRLQGLQERQRREQQAAQRRDARQQQRQQRQRPEPDDFEEMYGGGDPGMMQPNAQQQQPTRRLSASDRLQQEVNEVLQRLRDRVQQRNELLGLDEQGELAGQYGQGAWGGQMGPDPAMYPEEMAPGMMDAPYGQMPPGMQPGWGGRRGQQSQDQQEADRTMRVWAHDVTVEPGKTYRYRVVVSVLNPLFYQTRIDEEQREAYSNVVALGPHEEELEQAEWSEPVYVDQERYFFLVGGSTQQQTARLEVWRLYDGQWHVHEFEERPGNPVGGPAELDEGVEPLDMSVDAVVVDLVASGSGLGNTTRMLYLDGTTQDLTDRTVQGDSEDPIRIRLRNEQARRDVLAQMQDGEQAYNPSTNTLPPGAF